MISEIPIFGVYFFGNRKKFLSKFTLRGSKSLRIFSSFFFILIFDLSFNLIIFEISFKLYSFL